MAMTPEAAVKAKVRKVLDELGAYYVMPVTGGFGRQGAPDFLVCLSGRFVGIECKAGSNKPTPLQVKNLEQIQEAGGEAFVLNEDGIGQLREVLDSIVFMHKLRTL